MSRSKKSIDQDLIRELAALLKETELSEIEVEQDDLRIRVARTLTAAPAALHVPVARTDALPGPLPVEADAAGKPGTVNSPMVGTAYLSPSPGTPPFAPVGTEVKEGDTVLIIEAMKTMNHIPAPHTGKVTAVLIENGDPVEFGEPLMIIE